MHVIITCKYEKGLIKKKTTEKMWQHRFFHYNPLSVAMATSRRILPNFKLIQALMYVIVTCKYEMDPIKHSRAKVATPFFIIISLWGFFSDAQGQLHPQSVVRSG